MPDIQTFFNDIRSQIETDPVIDYRWTEFMPDLESAKIQTHGTNGRFVAVVWAGAESAELHGGNYDLWHFQVYNLVSSVFRRGGPQSVYAPVLLSDMQHIRNLLHMHNFPQACYSVSKEIYPTGTYNFQPSTAGYYYGGYCGFGLDVRVMEI